MPLVTVSNAAQVGQGGTAPEPSHAPAQTISFHTLRKVLFVALLLAILIFTGCVLFLVNRIFANFGPGVRADLEWTAKHGARELAQDSELGLAARDAPIIEKGFESYRASTDVAAIVAADPKGEPVASFGRSPEPPELLFAGRPGEVRRTPGYYVSWSRAEIEGATVGKLALVISTRRIVESERLLWQVELIIAIGSVLGLVIGWVFVGFFTSAIITRDARLADHAAHLERKVQERTGELDERNRGMHLVLDNVGQGFLTIDLDGRMAAEHSAVVERWLGDFSAGESFADYLGRKDPRVSDWLRLGFEELTAPALPLEVLLDQLPKQATVDQRTLALAYTPIAKDGVVGRLLVVMTDVSAEIQREGMERQQRETLALFQAISADRSGFATFLAEASRIVGVLRGGTGADSELDQRLVHTLKGNASLYRLDVLAQLCHDVETRIVEEGTPLTNAERFAIGSAWERVERSANDLLGEKGRAITVEVEDYEALEALVSEDGGKPALQRMLRSWRLEPAQVRLERLAEQMRQLARRLGKTPPEVRVDAVGLRLDPNRWAGFWSAFVHVARNAVDHGLEDVETRARLGKPAVGTIRLTADLVQDEVVIALQDDGPGVDWEKVAARAARLGLGHATRADLEAALFADGLSTKDGATLISGRGAGMAAVKDAVAQMSGGIAVRSDHGKGTSVEFRIRDVEAFKASRTAHLRPPAIRGDESNAQT